MRRLFFAILFCVLAIACFAQCLNQNIYSAGLIAPIATNATATTGNVRPDQYIPIYGLVVGYQYQMTSTVSTDYFTVRSGTYDGTVVAHGAQGLNFTAPSSGTFYVHLNTNAACGTTYTVQRTATITLITPGTTPAGCFNTSSWGSLTAPSTINGTATVRTVLAGNYVPMSGVVAGNTYQITSTINTDYISVRNGSFKGAIVAAGVQPLVFTAPLDGSYYIHVNTDAACGTNNVSRNITATTIYPVCTGTPVLGSAATTDAGPVCPVTKFSLSLASSPTVSGLAYQWQVSTAGATGTFTDIAGKTKDTANISGQTQTSWYRLKATCSGSGQSTFSDAVQVSQQAAANCYCISTYLSDNQNSYVNSVQLGTINNVTGRNAAAPNNYYSYASAPAANQTTNLAQGASATIVITFGSNVLYNAASAWIDFNADGDFSDAGEKLGGTDPDNISARTVTFNFTVPITATPGPTRLRVRSAYYNAVPDPCASVASNGETEDYMVTILAPCTGSLALGNATTSNAGPVCTSTSFNLAVSPAPVASDISYQWQVSTAGANGTYTDIPAQTSITATITGQSQTSWYRLKSFCTTTGQSGYSSAVQVTQQTASECYCKPEIGYDNGYGYISSVQLGTIDHVTGRKQPVNNSYYSYVSSTATTQTTNLARASSQTITIDVQGSLGGTKGTNSVAAWIDFNGDGDFYDTGEQLGTASNLPDGSVSFTFTVPADAVLGATRLRIRESLVYWSSPNPVTDPCDFMRTWGESDDYIVNITGACTGPTITLYRDADGDTYGNPAITLLACSSADLPSGWVADNTDCNDADAGLHASFPFYIDADADGYGAGAAVAVCAANATTPPAGYVLNNTDCDDGDNTKWQSATVYIDSDGDGYDNGTANICYGASIPQGYSNNTLGHDCDDADANVSAPYTLYRDSDHDGFGDAASSITVCPNSIPPSGYVTDNTDCDDTKMMFADADGDGYAGTTLVACGGLPTPGQDCDDNNPGIHDPKVYFRDNDGDGYGNFKDVKTECSNTAPAGYVNNAGDCNDFDATIYPGAPEICDGKDNNCDGQIDEGFDFVLYYRDADGDGYGDAALSTVAKCTAPDGYVANNTDCNDADATIHAPVQYYVDADGDGYGSATVAMICSSTAPSGYSTNNTDCNDADAKVHSSFSFYADNDGDGYGAGSLVTVCAMNADTPPSGYALNNTDCNDNNAALWRIGNFYRDGDGDGYTIGNGETVCYGASVPQGYRTNTKGSDCNDADATVWRSGTFYKDVDGDGYTVGVEENICYGASFPLGYRDAKSTAPDCDDANAAIGAAVSWYLDSDNDGYYTGNAVLSCSSPGMGYKSSGLFGAGDCNDADRTVHPGAPELCDGKDNDCNGQVDEGCNLLAVSSLTLVNATSSLDLYTIASGTTIDLATIPGKAINIRANTTPAKVGSVRFVLSGTATKTVTENILPYALFGDNEKGDYNNWTPKVGTYTLTATPYTKSGAKGMAGTPITVSFNVVDNSSALSGLTLVNAATDRDMGPLTDGQVIDLSLTPSINIRANPISGASVGSVRFSLNSTLNYKTENIPPFTIAGDNNKGDYYKWNIAPGSYTVQATPYGKDNAKGIAGVPVTVTFTIIRSGAATKTAQLEVKEKITTPLVAGTVYPNPTTGVFTLQLQSGREEKADLLIVDGRGVVVERRQKLLMKGTQTLSFNLSGKAAGLYSLQVQSASGAQSFRVVLVH